MRLSLTLRELFLVILLVATVSLFLNIQANHYGVLVNGGKLVLLPNVSYDVMDRVLVQKETFKVVGGRSLNQHGPEMMSQHDKRLNMTSDQLIFRLREIESRIMSISRQPIITLVDENVSSDVIDRILLQNISGKIIKASDHLDWVDDNTVVQGGNWSIMMCMGSNSCPEYGRLLYKKVNTIKAMKEYINNTTKMCELSRKMDEEFQDSDSFSTVTLKKPPTAPKDIKFRGPCNELQDDLQTPKRHSVLTNELNLSTSGSLLRLRMLVTSLLPLRFYIHSTVESGSSKLVNSVTSLNEFTVEYIFQYISETYGLGTSSRWWITLQTTLVKYFTSMNKEIQQRDINVRCERCFIEVFVDVLCSSIEHCIILQLKETSSTDTGMKKTESMLDTLSITVPHPTTLQDVRLALRDSQICDSEDPVSCLTDSDLIFLLDNRREQLLLDGKWIKVYPSKEGNSIFRNIHDLDITLGRRHSGLTNQILSNLEQYYSEMDAENRNAIDLPYDTDVGVQDGDHVQREEYSSENNRCSEDPNVYKDIDTVHTEPVLDLTEVKPSHLYSEVPYETIIVRIWAFAKYCRCIVTLGNKYNSPGAKNISIGLGNNTFHLLVIDRSVTNTVVVNTLTVTIYRHSRGHVIPTRIKHVICELKQDCSLLFNNQDVCGLRPLSGKQFPLKRCRTGAEEGRWIVPCSSCHTASSCIWREAVWQPFACSYSKYTKWSLKRCLHNKKLLFIGDSTNRGIMNYIMEQINGTLRQWDKIHNTRAYTNLNDNSSLFTFAYYPHFWLPADHRPKFQKSIYQLIKSSLPLYNNASTVLIVGGVQWLAREHIDSIIEALKLKGLLNIQVVIKGLGAGFHQPIEGVRFVPPEQQQALQLKERDILTYARTKGFHVVSTFNMTMARYRDFLEGKCACHFHKVSKVLHNNEEDSDTGYTITGDVNAAYSNIVINQICGG